MATPASSSRNDVPERPAGLPRRLAAYAADCVLLFAFVLVAQGALLLLDLHPFAAAFAGGAQPAPILLHLWVAASTTVPFAAYFAAGFASARGATIGQRLAGIAVRSADGRRLGRTRAIVRALVLLLPFEVNHALMFHAGPWAGGSDSLFVAGMAAVWALCGLYIALPLLRSDSASLHDLAAASCVLDTRR